MENSVKNPRKSSWDCQRIPHPPAPLRSAKTPTRTSWKKLVFSPRYCCYIQWCELLLRVVWDNFSLVDSAAEPTKRLSGEPIALHQRRRSHFDVHSGSTSLPLGRWRLSRQRAHFEVQKVNWNPMLGDNTNWLVTSRVWLLIGWLVVRYAAEIHFVHYNKKYGTFPNSTGHPDGLAVVGVFVTVLLFISMRLLLFLEALPTPFDWMIDNSRREMRRTKPSDRFPSPWRMWWKPAPMWIWRRLCRSRNSFRRTDPSSTAIRDLWPLLDARRSSLGPFLNLPFKFHTDR